jgi:hypothetical protein
MVKIIGIANVDLKEEALLSKLLVMYSRYKGKSVLDLSEVPSNELSIILEQTPKIKTDFDQLIISINPKEITESYKKCDIILISSGILRFSIIKILRLHSQLLHLEFAGKIIMVPTNINPMFKEWHRWNDYQAPTSTNETVYTHKSDMPISVINGFINSNESTNDMDDHPVKEVLDELYKFIN